MRVLIITPVLPYPPNDGGKIRLFELVKRLTPRHELVLATLLDPASDLSHVRILESFGLRVIWLPKPLLRDDFPAKILRAVNTQPRLLTEYYSTELAALIRRVAQEFNPDIVHCEQVHAAIYATPFRHIPRLLVQHVARYEELFRRIADARPGAISRLAGRVDALKVRRYERHAWGSFTAIATVSEQDQTIIRHAAPTARVYVVPNGVDTEYFQPGNIPPNRGTLIMTGTVGYFPNLDGITWFLRDIFPSIRADHPGVSLQIVGRGNTALEQRMEMPPNVVLTGEVEDVRPYVARSAVFIVPLRVGGGTRLKILEAMAQGIPVISTSIGCEGLEVVDGEHLLVADTPQRFAEATGLLLRDATLRQKLTANGRRLVVEQYDWDRIVEKLENVYADMASGATRAPVHHKG